VEGYSEREIRAALRAAADQTMAQLRTSEPPALYVLVSLVAGRRHRPNRFTCVFLLRRPIDLAPAAPGPKIPLASTRRSTK